jgi:hypothetical protein
MTGKVPDPENHAAKGLWTASVPRFAKSPERRALRPRPILVNLSYFFRVKDEDSAAVPAPPGENPSLIKQWQWAVEDLPGG